MKVTYQASVPLQQPAPQTAGELQHLKQQK